MASSLLRKLQNFRRWNEGIVKYLQGQSLVQGPTDFQNGILLGDCSLVSFLDFYDGPLN